MIKNVIFMWFNSKIKVKTKVINNVYIISDIMFTIYIDYQ